MTLRILFVLVLLCAGFSARAEPFDARPLDRDEKRYLQAALAHAGTYKGLLDGDWGRGSQRALERRLSHKPPSAIGFPDLGPILADFDAEMRRGGWEVLYLESTDMSVLLPSGLMILDPDSEHATLSTPDRSLLVRWFVETDAQTGAMHNWLVDNHAGPEELYTLWKGSRAITSARLASGKLAYMVSYRGAGASVSTLVQYEPAHRARGQVIVASLSRGAQAALALPPGGRLAAVFSGHAAPRIAAAPETPARRPDPGDAPRGSGTGFYVNTTDIVTATHVIAGCARLALEDGTPLEILSRDAALDLAVLGSARRSPHFLPLAGAADSQLGEDVFALGFPYRGMFGQGLTVTGGNVSALPGLNDPAKRLMITAPVQPGNSGGPLVNRRGEVLGVVVSRADDMAVLGQTGTLPQNMNFAVSAGPLLEFLKSADILFPQGHDRAGAFGEGIPERVQASVVAILCY